MIIVLNGKETEVGEGSSITDLLAAKEIDPATVVVELGGEIVPGERFATTSLNDGDHLEVLRLVGGG